MVLILPIWHICRLTFLKNVTTSWIGKILNGIGQYCFQWNLLNWIYFLPSIYSNNHTFGILLILIYINNLYWVASSIQKHMTGTKCMLQNQAIPLFGINDSSTVTIYYIPKWLTNSSKRWFLLRVKANNGKLILNCELVCYCCLMSREQ